MKKIAKIVGCGLSGVTAAILLKDLGYQVTIFEKRNHIGGNCYDSNIQGTLVHNYGPHTFHTNDEEVFAFLSKYTEWFDFRYTPLGETELGIIPLPYSRSTIKRLGRELTQKEIINFIFKDYSEKQWGVPFDEIPKSITNRIPKTANDENPTWYKDEKYQCLPKHGYTKMIENMLKNITVKTDCDDNEWKNFEADLTVYTGKIDEYFGYCYGRLPYRSLDFIHKTSNTKLPAVTINQNNKKVKYTRKYDHSYFNYKHKGLTIITEEYPKECKENDIPYYPMPFGEGIELYNKYKELTLQEKNVIFVGRLATYTYLDMWMAVKQAMLKIKNYEENSKASNT